MKFVKELTKCCPPSPDHPKLELTPNPFPLDLSRLSDCCRCVKRTLCYEGLAMRALCNMHSKCQLPLIFHIFSQWSLCYSGQLPTRLSLHHYICAHNLPDHRIWHGQWPWLQMAKQAFYKVLKDCCGWIFSKSKINRSLKNLLTFFLEIYCCGPGVCARDTCLNFVSLFLHESINWTESPQQLILFSLFVFAPVFPAATCAA